MPVGGNGHPSDLPAVCCEITRPITNTGDVSSPTSRLYSSQAETAEPTSEQREDTDACINSHQRASGPGLAGVAEGLQIVHEPDGTSRLSGTLKDQPALPGVLTNISHLILPLLSLESTDPPP